MSCQLHLISKICNLLQLKQFLNPNTAQTNTTDTADFSDWNEDWGDPQDETSPSQSPFDTQLEEANKEDDWLSDCEVSVSSLGEIITIGRKDKLAVLQINYEGSGSTILTILWKGVVAEYAREAVTSVLCLPLISHKRSAEGAPEWTCIIVGFNTGYVRIYDETGTKVLDQMLHNESVMSVKCKTYIPPRYFSYSDHTEELTILYETVVVSLDGFGLFQTLRACKNRAAMAAATGSSDLELPPLSYKKWGLKGQGQATDHISVGQYSPNPFDQMQTASVAGFKERISSTPPTCSVFACTGDNPYIGVYHAMDGESYELLNNVTEVATKLLSVGAKKLMSWGASYFRKSEPQSEAEKIQSKITPATPSFRRHGIFDERRFGQSISISPSGTDAAVTDSLGRVLLVDTRKGIIRRMWKGYRQAQVGWMMVKERSSSRQQYRRHAFFLVIYAPKRGLLEIWLAANGPRVGAFNVGKGCRLIYPGCSMLGLNSSSYKLVKGKLFQCFLLKPDGELLDINIPFHLALSDANSKRAHDQQLMVLLKSALRAEDDNTQLSATDIWEPISKMKLTLSHRNALSKILSLKQITSDVALTIIQNIVKLVKTTNQKKALAAAASKGAADGDGDLPIDVECRMLLELCDSLKLLIEMHTTLRQWCQVESDTKVVDLSSLLPVDEVSSLLQTDFSIKSSRKVGFSADSQLNLCNFLVMFDTEHGHKIKLRLLNADEMAVLGQILFEPCLKYEIEFEKLRELVESLQLQPRYMLDLILRYYFSLQNPSTSYLPVLESIIYSLYTAHQEMEASGAPEEVSSTQEPATPDLLTPNPDFDHSSAFMTQSHEVSWWTHIRDQCESVTCFKSYLHIALVCRSICIKETNNLTNEFPDSSDDNKKEAGTCESGDELWEHLSVEVILWNLSIKHLEDVSKLNKLLKHKVNISCNSKSKELPNVTVKDIKTGNKGLVGELVGRWCLSNQLPAADLLKYDTDLDNNSDTAEKDVMGPYGELRKAFPISLTPDTVYANASWEFVSHWNKDTSSIYLLKFALDYLACIANGCLRHGICLMIWNTYLLKKVSALVSLVEKVGKTPKDRLCVKEVGMDTATTAEFMTVVCDYMEIFLQANCDFSEPLIYKEEPRWASEDTTGHSLVQMACQWKETNYRLLKHHSNLLSLVTAILTFNMKSVKIMTLFDHNGQAAFFQQLTSHPYMGIEGKDDLMSVHRTEFLCRILLNSVERLPDRATVQTASRQIRVDPTSDAMRWPEIVMKLAESFLLDTDHLRKHHVSLLVSHGYDLLALEVVPFMKNSQLAYVSMLELCAQRFSHFMLESNQETLTEITSAASPALINWLNERYTGGIAARDVPMTDTNSLLLHIVQGLHSTPKELRFAQELYSLTADRC